MTSLDSKIDADVPQCAPVEPAQVTSVASYEDLISEKVFLLECIDEWRTTQDDLLDEITWLRADKERLRRENLSLLERLDRRKARASGRRHPTQSSAPGEAQIAGEGPKRKNPPGDAHNADVSDREGPPSKRQKAAKEQKDNAVAGSKVLKSLRPNYYVTPISRETLVPEEYRQDCEDGKSDDPVDLMIFVHSLLCLVVCFCVGNAFRDLARINYAPV